MISAVESISTIACEELIGATCYVKNFDGEMTECIITRVDLFISIKGIGVKAHLKRATKGTINYPECVTLENYNYNVSYGPVGFLTSMSYEKFYSDQG